MPVAQLANILLLVGIVLAAVLNWLWFWGVLFLTLSLAGLATGEMHLVTVVRRSQSPVIFFAAVAVWGLAGLYYLAATFFPTWGLV